MDNKVLNDTKLFEKIEIGWFSVEQLQERKPEFRRFYQEIVDKFLEQANEIQHFAEKKRRKPSKSFRQMNKTQKRNDKSD
jgi:hypothetical protein